MATKLISILMLLSLIGAAAAAEPEPQSATPAANQFSLTVGNLRNGDRPNDVQVTTTYTGVGLKYARSLFSGITTEAPTIRDFVKLEAGVSFYRVVAFARTQDQTLVLPATLTARYGFAFFDRIELSVYAGALKNFAILEEQAPGYDKDVPRELKTWQPALGAGIAGKLKGFVLRLDVGYEAVLGGIGYEY